MAKKQEVSAAEIAEVLRTADDLNMTLLGLVERISYPGPQADVDALGAARGLANLATAASDASAKLLFRLTMQQDALDLEARLRSEATPDIRPAENEERG